MKNVLDSNGDLSIVQSRKNANSGYWNYASSFKYNAAGAVTSMQLGNGTWESTTFNSRFQPTQIALGKTQNATNLLDLDFTYGTTDNNGNVRSQTITVPTVGGTNGFTAVQTYNYDSLNRIKDATENITPHGGSQSQSWKQTFTFDRYGNRRFDFANGNTTMPESTCTEAICNPTISTSDNRITSGGYSFARVSYLDESSSCGHRTQPDYAAAASDVWISFDGSSDVISRMISSVEFGTASDAVAAFMAR